MVVPTGNFGNILAAYYAQKNGDPPSEVEVRFQSNKVLTDFIRTGTYDRRREFLPTASPYGHPGFQQFGRLLYDLAGETVCNWPVGWKELAESGCYSVGDAVREQIQTFVLRRLLRDDQNTAATIRQLWEEEGYLCDTHTAVAVNVPSVPAERKRPACPHCDLASTATL